MAHMVIVTVFVNAPPLPICREGTPLQTQGLPHDARSFAARMAANESHVFLASSCLTPNEDLLYLIRNKVDY